MTTTPITTAELITLFREKPEGVTVDGVFNRTGLHLDNTPDNKWALDRVKLMRAAA